MLNRTLTNGYKINCIYCHNTEAFIAVAPINPFGDIGATINGLDLVSTSDSGVAVQFNFTQPEKDALLAFFNTLTDHAMLEDEKYSDPFD